MNLDLSDDEDIAQAFDMHSLIISSLQHSETDDYIATAEEVISEIETMMQVGERFESVLSFGFLF